MPSPEINRQVAAVCYRKSPAGTEFLLVRTTGGRWTFPKGNSRPGKNAAREAAREAYEEAGAIGVCERAPLAVYRHVKAGWDSWPRLEYEVVAFLMQVSLTVRNREAARTPRWFSPDEAKERLATGRSTELAAELMRIIELAVKDVRASRARHSA